MYLKTKKVYQKSTIFSMGCNQNGLYEVQIHLMAFWIQFFSELYTTLLFYLLSFIFLLSSIKIIQLNKKTKEKNCFNNYFMNVWSIWHIFVKAKMHLMTHISRAITYKIILFRILKTIQTTVATWGNVFTCPSLRPCLIPGTHGYC